MMHLIETFEHLKVPLEAIKLATNNFGNENCIGGGGFGKVYKGELVVSGVCKIVALKRLDSKFGQGNPEFWKEIITLSIYKHENIVSLLGFCDEGNEKILIYEYASRGSLDFYINNGDLTWIPRLKICIGAARGLAYLHDPGATHQRVLHRDIKSSNILLDESWNALIADLGLSKFGPANQQYTFLVSNAVGTIGYCDPLYLESGLLTKESDVYSFGVVLFEVLCGRLCIGNTGDKRRPLTGLVRQYYKEGNLNEIIHANIKDEITSSCLQEFTAIAYQCLSRDLKRRPKMSEVVSKLETALQYQNARHVRAHHENVPKQEDGPGIEGFKIIGDAKPGGKLLGCGFPVRGTSLCMFQWVRHLQDGTREYIQGARNPEYVVTADDVDKLIAVECIPMDDEGRQGEQVHLFANEQNKISCDQEMQQEIDKYMSAGQASFSVLLQMDSSENWEQTTFFLRRSNYQIKIDGMQDIFIDEKYSSVLSIKIPPGLSSQFVLTRLNGSSHPFTFDDVRMRDTLVLTMRMFQSKQILDLRA